MPQRAASRSIGFLGLALGADEDDQAAAAGDLGEERVGAEQAAHGFAQVDDVDEIALAVDVRPHLGIPAAGPVSEMDAGFDQFLNLNNRHAKHLLRLGATRAPQVCNCRIFRNGIVGVCVKRAKRVYIFGTRKIRRH